MSRRNTPILHLIYVVYYPSKKGGVLRDISAAPGNEQTGNWMRRGLSLPVKMPRKPKTKRGKRKTRYSGKRGGCLSMHRPTVKPSSMSIEDFLKSYHQPQVKAPVQPPSFASHWGQPQFSQLKAPSFHQAPMARLAHHQPRMASLRHQPKSGSWGAGLKGGC